MRLLLKISQSKCIFETLEVKQLYLAYLLLKTKMIELSVGKLTLLVLLLAN